MTTCKRKSPANQPPGERPKKLTPAESLKRMKAFTQRKEQLIAACRKSKN
jgi:hypothetical protein